MTHGEVLSGNHLGLEPTDCTGELVPRGQYPDRTMAGRDDEGRMVDRLIDVYRCAECGTTVSMCGVEVLNAYPDPARLVRSLAESFQVRK